MADQSQPNATYLSDDQSVPHVSCYDDPNTTKFDITPNLEKFAKQGMRFDRHTPPLHTHLIWFQFLPVVLHRPRCHTIAQPAQGCPIFTDVLAWWVWAGPTLSTP